VKYLAFSSGYGIKNCDQLKKLSGLQQRPEFTNNVDNFLFLRGDAVILKTKLTCHREFMLCMLYVFELII
jgi:hypothetical protein